MTMHKNKKSPSFFTNLFIAMAFLLSFCLMAPFSAFATPAPQWGYQGKIGPKHWGSLSPAYKTCAMGKHQSPINIRLVRTKAANLGPIQFHYRATPLDMINNGHTIQLNYKPGSNITVQGETYKLVQLHFHSPSENRIDRQPFPMEMHLVHKSASGKLAVVAVFFKVGKYNHEIAKLWKHMPALNKEVTAPGILINAMNLLPKDRDYYFWMGSLTTPPCSENVAWYLLQKPIEISRSQVRQFVAMMGHNNRPVQPLNDRIIKRVNFFKVR